MNDNTRSLLIYLEAQLVLKHGCINQMVLNQSDRLQTDLWQQQGMLSIELLPTPDRSHTQLYTHKLRFGKQMWEMAWAARKEKAEITQPTLKIHKNGKKEQAPGPKAKQQLDLTDFKQYLSDHGESMTIPQSLFAEALIQTFNTKKLNFFLTGKQTGKSWILKAIDQYITTITKQL